MVYKALDIANILLAKAASNVNEGELMSNMKLQKLLYYQQGFHLALFGEPLFEEEIEAWMYGPVVPVVYNNFQDSKNGGIVASEPVLELDEEQAKLFDAVYDMYGNYSAIGLMNMTHNEMPWKNTVTGKGNIISQKMLIDFFESRINK